MVIPRFPQENIFINNLGNRKANVTYKNYRHAYSMLELAIMDLLDLEAT